MNILRWWRRRRVSVRHPSWRVVYPDGARSYALMREDAEARAALFGGVVEYARDAAGNLL